MASPADGISDLDFQRLRGLIGTRCGLAVTPAKRTMLETRLRKRARALGMSSVSAYCQYVCSASGAREEWANLVHEVTTHKTDFFREASHFDFLTAEALPELQRTSGAGVRRPLLAWSAACSTGEEPYTLAMVLSRYAESTASGLDFRIEASDISEAVLETARQAVYTEDAIRPLAEDLRRKYLLRSRDRRGVFRISPEIRARVHYQQLNLMERSYGFTDPFDVVLCRNVMIYFDRPTQESILARIACSLRRGGYLLMGHSESLNGLELPLEQVAPTVYRRSHE